MEVGVPSLTRRPQFSGISIRGNRLFGDPPLNPTYLCLWDITLDDVAGSLDVTLIKGIMRALQAFKYNYNDMENAPLWLYAPPVDPDGELNASCILE